MNTELIKKHPGMVLFVVALLAVLGFSGWKLKGALSQNASLLAQIGEQEGRLNELQRFRPYPSNDNLEDLRRNRAALESLLDQLKQASYRQVEVPEVDQVQFARLLGEKLAQLSNRARQANVKLPDQFVFGFDQYIGKLPPDNRFVIDTLTKQFLVITRLSQLLYESGVYSISTLRGRPVDVPAGDEAPAASNDKIFQLTPFEVTFTCDTDSLQKFLNELAAAEWLLVVRSMNIELKTVSFTVLVEEEPPPAPTRDPYGMSGRYPPTLPPSRPAGPTTKTVQKEQIEVTMQIDLVEFPEPPAAAATAPTEAS